MDKEPLSDEEIIKKFKINTEKYKLINYWSKQQPNGTYLVSAFTGLKKEQEKVDDSFLEFLKTYKPKAVSIPYAEPFTEKAKGSVIINAQDAH